MKMIKKEFLKPINLIPVLILVLYLAPYIFLGYANHWTIWDNLDNEFVHYKILLNSGKLFSSNQTIIDQPLGGIPRISFRSEFDPFVLLYKLLGEKWAYIINRILMSIIGFIGMNFFLKEYLLKNQSDEIIRMVVSLCFSILPFWPWAGLSVSGMPLLFYALFNIRLSKNHAWWNWLIIILYTYYSSFIHSGIFLLIFLSLILVFDFIKKKNYFFLFAILLISSLYIIFNYRLFLEFFFPSDFVSHRVEQIYSSEIDFKTAIFKTLSLFINGSGHALSLHKWVILPIVFLSSLFIFFSSKTISNRNIFILVNLTILLISFFYGFQQVGILSTLTTSIRNIIPIQIDRFYFLSPFLWMIVFALALSILKKFIPFFRIFIFFVAVLQILYSFKRHETYVNFNDPTVEEFFAINQFQDIRKYINIPLNQFRVGSIGLHPTIALYNGFYTLDGYWANYPLNYKNKFREIISNELEKDLALKSYYDKWGNRVYLFNTLTKRNMEIRSGNKIEIQILDYNWNAFYSLGGRYILSSVKINSKLIPNLIFEKEFVNKKESAWDIYLYKVQLLPK